MKVYVSLLVTSELTEQHIQELHRSERMKHLQKADENENDPKSATFRSSTISKGNFTPRPRFSFGARVPISSNILRKISKSQLQIIRNFLEK